MKLNELRPAKGAVSKRWRRGQGPGSGNGKTAGRGTKGQRSRSGFSARPGFEGGQMPLYRRIPKRGFFNPFRLSYSVINLDRLNELFEAGTEITVEMLSARGLIKNKADGIKLLGDGDLNKSLVIHAHRASASALAKIEAAGGRVALVEVRQPYRREPRTKPKSTTKPTTKPTEAAKD